MILGLWRPVLFTCGIIIFIVIDHLEFLGGGGGAFIVIGPERETGLPSIEFSSFTTTIHTVQTDPTNPCCAEPRRTCTRPETVICRMIILLWNWDYRRWGLRGGYYNAISEQIHPDTPNGEPRNFVIGPLILPSRKSVNPPYPPRPPRAAQFPARRRLRKRSQAALAWLLDF